MTSEELFSCESTQYSPKVEQNNIPYRKKRPTNWTVEEQRLYLDFIRQNAKDMKKQQTKRKRVFVFMAKVIKSRTSTQIKTHHQKLERRCKTVEGIIAYLEAVLFSKPFSQSDVQRAIPLEHKESGLSTIGTQCESSEELGNYESRFPLFPDDPLIWIKPELDHVWGGQIYNEDSPLI